MTEFLKTGIAGLDEILKGGLRRGCSVLITGSPGSGKTLICLQFLYNGAELFNENGIYVTSEETSEDLRGYAESIGFDIRKYEKSGHIILVEKPLASLKGGLISIKGLVDVIKRKKIKRMVIDSLTFFEYLYSNKTSEIEFRRHVIEFMHEMKKTGVTTMAISEKYVTDIDRQEWGRLDFVFEGLILLTRNRKGSYFERTIAVIKARGQDHSLDIFPLAITSAGVRVLHDQLPFSLLEKDIEKRRQ